MKAKKINELQSATKPIDNSHNAPRYDDKNMADVLGYKNHTLTYSKIKEFEEEVDSFYIKKYKEFNRKRKKDLPPYEDDLISQNDFNARAFEDEMYEDAYAVGGEGMGAVVPAIPSETPGETSLTYNVGDTFGNGGRVGSGDVGMVFNRNVIKRPNGSRRKNKLKAQVKAMSKNMKNVYKKDMYKTGGNVGNIKSFSDFTKK